MKFISSILIFLIQLYRYLFSPILGSNCRFNPTCSLYAIEAIVKHGVLIGIFLAIKRILKCHPWGKFGFDPVPLSKITIKFKHREKTDAG